MEHAKFEALVARMEQFAAERPTAYRRRVFALAGLGYAYLVLVVLVLVAACVLTIASIYYVKMLAVKLLFAVGALLVVVLRSLWVKFEPPRGERLTQADAPRLFQLLDELRQMLRTPPVHQVLVTPEFNAGVI